MTQLVHTCYLLGAIDCSVTPPRFVGVDCFSEPHPTTSMNLFHFEIVTAVGLDYQQAFDKMLEMTAARPDLHWVRRLDCRAWKAWPKLAPVPERVVRHRKVAKKRVIVEPWGKMFRVLVDGSALVDHKNRFILFHTSESAKKAGDAAVRAALARRDAAVRAALARRGDG